MGAAAAVEKVQVDLEFVHFAGSATRIPEKDVGDGLSSVSKSGSLHRVDGLGATC